MSIDCDFVFRREHPRRRANREIWERIRAAYNGGDSYIQRALIKHVSEVEPEYLERQRRACYFNYPRKLSNLITNYVLSVEPQRDGASPELVEDFSRDGLRVNEVMRRYSTMLNLYGNAALLVEMPYFEGEIDEERKISERLRPGVRVLSPLEIADWATGSDGKLQWLILEECRMLDNGPFLPPTPVRRRKLWTREEYYIFESSRDGSVQLLAQGKNPLDAVPVVMMNLSEHAAVKNGTFEDVVRISDAILNNQSESQMNIVKQMFGLLVISDTFARGVRSEQPAGKGSSAERFSHIIARSAAIWETPEERGISRYISPSGADSATIREENMLLKQELYEILGLTLTPGSKQPESAESKSWDQHQTRQFLTGRVDLLEQSEIACWELMHRFDETIPIPSVIYNREFAVVDLQHTMEALLGIHQLADGPEFRKEIGRTALFLLEKIKKVPSSIRSKILKELEGTAHV
ncbi:MAG: hypothetical protein J6R85_01155 [Lentisphaeria bacterium]|nr:hypothetical protein [Lentisphaeria bacterium]